MEPQTEAAGRGSGARGVWLLAVASLVLSTLAAEQVLRWIEPELHHQRHQVLGLRVA